MTAPIDDDDWLSPTRLTQPDMNDPMFLLANKIWKAVRDNFPKPASDEELKKVNAIVDSVLDIVLHSGRGS